MLERFMKEALKEAHKAYAEQEVPIGCVIVHEDRIIARAHNQKIKKNDSTCHAEMLALKKAQKYLGSKYLTDCTAFVTLEPCAMCAGAMVNVRLGRLYFGAKEPKTGCCGSVLNVIDNACFNHSVKAQGGVMESECKELMQKFFKEKREKC